MVRQRGLEPLTYGLEGRCSIRLSYWRNYSISLRTNFTKNFFNRRNSRIFYNLLVDFILSGRSGSCRKPATCYIAALNILLELLTSSSGRQDSNLRPPAPKAGAITGLRYAPYKNNFKFIKILRPSRLSSDNLQNRDKITGRNLSR